MTSSLVVVVENYYKIFEHHVDPIVDCKWECVYFAVRLKTIAGCSRHDRMYHSKERKGQKVFMRDIKRERENRLRTTDCATAKTERKINELIIIHWQGRSVKEKTSYYIVHQRKSFINTLIWSKNCCEIIDTINPSISFIHCLRGLLCAIFALLIPYKWNYSGVEQSKHFYCSDRSDILDEDDEEMGSLLCWIFFYDQLDATILIT